MMVFSQVGDKTKRKRSRVMDVSNNMCTITEETNRKESIVCFDDVKELQMQMANLSFEDVPDCSPVSDSSGSTATGCDSPQTNKSTYSDISDSNSVLRIEKEGTKWMDLQSQPRKICWGDVDIRYYPIIAGDHPDTTQGPPITIGWVPVKETREKLDEFEGKHKERRHEDELRLSWLERRRILRRCGVTEDEILESLETAHKVRRQRQQTLHWRKFDKVEEIKQSFRRKLGRAIFPKKKLATRY